MDKEFYVVKFGEKYYKNQSAAGDDSIITLTDDLNMARQYFKIDHTAFKNLLKLGGSIVEVNIREYDRTYSIEQELGE